MNKYEKRVNKTTKETIHFFKGTAFEGSYVKVRRELKAEVKKIKKQGLQTAF